MTDDGGPGGPSMPTSQSTQPGAQEQPEPSASDLPAGPDPAAPDVSPASAELPEPDPGPEHAAELPQPETGPAPGAAVALLPPPPPGREPPPGHHPPPSPAFVPPPPPSFAPAWGFGGYAPAVAPAPVPLPPPTAETLAIPLGPRKLVGVSLDLLTRPDSGLRSASFYIGLILLVTVGPVVALFGIAVASGGTDSYFGSARPEAPPAWLGWLFLALVPAFLGFLAASVEARTLAAAVIAGRAEGRPLRLRESIAVARARFWSVLAAVILLGILSFVIEYILTEALSVELGSVDAIAYAVSVTVGVVVGTPFIYTTAGIVLGEAGTVEALRRSISLARARKRLAVVVTLFSVLAGLVVQFGLGIALDTISRVLSGAGLVDHFPAPLVVPLAAAMVFAYGTLVLLTEAIAAAPAVHAFVALTHYTGGLEQGRRQPLSVRHAWDPWFTPGLAGVTILGLVALVAGILSLPWG